MKNETNNVSGLINAITTPFNKNNTVDEGAFKEHLIWLWGNGVKSILIAGTTGEFFSLTQDEKMALLKIARDIFKGNIIFHGGSNVLKDTVNLAHFAKDSGADYFASLLPFYLSKLPEAGIIKYLQTISESTDLPFIIYNFPLHTNVSLNCEILKQVNHFGIKDSSADLNLIKCTDNYFIGSDKKLLLSHAEGGIGFVSARSNVRPFEYSRLSDLLKTDNLVQIKKSHLEILGCCEKFSGENQIKLIKKELTHTLKGYPEYVRLPLV
ncbi:MAG: dihydrodipicolinate synthase family protein [Deltaproteobacteria bacterium]|nr:dihydrodipicolinate synthase family protein [Deltaproteobacteria bacterium]